MTNKELFELVESGAKPLVRVVNEKTIDETLFDDGMIGIARAPDTLVVSWNGG